MTAQDRGRLERTELPSRRPQAQSRMHGETFAVGEEVVRRSECVAAEKDCRLRPPERDLVPEASVLDRHELERADSVAWHTMMRYAQSGGERGAVALMAIEQLEDAGRSAGGMNSLVEALPVERVDQPDTTVLDERVRAALHEFVRDPAESRLELVAVTDSHAAESTGTP
jgi:hypothetical protein